MRTQPVPCVAAVLICVRPLLLRAGAERTPARLANTNEARPALRGTCPACPPVRRAEGRALADRVHCIPAEGPQLAARKHYAPTVQTHYAGASSPAPRLKSPLPPRPPCAWCAHTLQPGVVQPAHKGEVLADRRLACAHYIHVPVLPMGGTPTAEVMPAPPCRTAPAFVICEGGTSVWLVGAPPPWASAMVLSRCVRMAGLHRGHGHMCESRRHPEIWRGRMRHRARQHALQHRWRAGSMMLAPHHEHPRGGYRPRPAPLANGNRKPPGPHGVRSLTINKKVLCALQALQCSMRAPRRSPTCGQAGGWHSCNVAAHCGRPPATSLSARRNTVLPVRGVRLGAPACAPPFVGRADLSAATSMVGATHGAGYHWEAC